MESSTFWRAENVTLIAAVIVGAAILVGIIVLYPHTGKWVQFLWGLAAIVWAVGALRNHPLRSLRDVLVFIAAVVVVSVLINLGTPGAMTLLSGVGVGMLLSTFGKTSIVPNPYRNQLCRILMGISGMTILAHAFQVVYFVFIRGQ